VGSVKPLDMSAPNGTGNLLGGVVRCRLVAFQDLSGLRAPGLAF
jgi:hypothetical protein